MPPVPHIINDKLAIKQCPDVVKGLGVFATRVLSKGLRLHAELPYMIEQSRDEAIENAGEFYAGLSEYDRMLFNKLYAGIQDIVPYRRVVQIHTSESMELDRATNIIKLNAMEGLGAGCVLSFIASFINHSCVPNAWAEWNPNINAVTIHALREIQADEEVTISYFQEMIYLSKAQRQQKLACNSAESNGRRAAMSSIRHGLTARFGAGVSTVNADELYTSMESLRELESLIIAEGLHGLELSSVLVEQAGILGHLGDERARRIKLSHAVQARNLCLGPGHPSSLNLANRL
ncbi:hypothetical protein F4819DRAFT_507679 [Hypoxylon fuscum]|nr:hypothetical protein F4819DRAFT_507679 [Hypoxylon fuscum]